MSKNDKLQYKSSKKKLVKKSHKVVDKSEKKIKLL